MPIHGRRLAAPEAELGHPQTAASGGNAIPESGARWCRRVPRTRGGDLLSSCRLLPDFRRVDAMEAGRGATEVVTAFIDRETDEIKSDQRRSGRQMPEERKPVVPV